MSPIKFEEATRVLGAGDNPNTNDMWVATVKRDIEPGVGGVMSCWELSDDEIAEIVKNRRVYLNVMCRLDYPTQPPVLLMVHNPFQNQGFIVLQNRNGGERMFEGRANPLDLVPFECDGVLYSMTITQGDYTFLLAEVVECEGENKAHGRASKPYFKAWEILSDKYKEI